MLSVRGFCRRVGILMVVGVSSTSILAQEPARRLELGVNATSLRTMGVTDWCAACPKVQWGAGPSMTYNLNRRFAIDSTFSFFPSSGTNSSSLVGGNMIQGLVGVKATARSRKFSMFAKARPGFIRWSEGRWTDFSVSGPPLNPTVSPKYGARTNFMVDFGGGIELAVTPQISIRTEMGDSVMWWHEYGGTLDSGGFGPGVTNNLQVSNSVRYHFGRALDSERKSGAVESHKFLDRTNIALWTVSLLGQTADMVTTQRFMTNCKKNSPFANDPHIGCASRESNPIARPFVNHGWGGQIALAGIVNTVQITAAWGLHKLGMHKVERVVPLPMAVSGAILGYKNLQRSTTSQ